MGCRNLFSLWPPLGLGHPTTGPTLFLVLYFSFTAGGWTDNERVAGHIRTYNRPKEGAGSDDVVSTASASEA